MFKFSLLTTTALIFSAPAFAQVAPQPSAAAQPDSDAITVTATRTPTPIDQVASSVTVLDKAAIDRSQDIGVSELLLRTPGVSISRNGGYGTATSLRIRGAETDQTVAVIDGVKLNDPSGTGGGYNFGNLLVGDASRIEVLRGPQSILWGSQAIGGVVNIVTALPESPLGGSADLEGGSRGTFNGRAAIGGKTDRLTWRLGGNYFTTDGISAIAPSAGGKERDGYTNRGATGRTEIKLLDNVTADFRGYYSRGHVDSDGFAGDTPEYSNTRDFIGYAGLNVDLLGGRFRNRFGYGYTATDRDNYNPLLARQLTFDAAGRNRRFEYQGSFAIVDGWNAVFGLENERSRFHSVAPSSSLAVPIPAPIHGTAELTGVYADLNAEVIKGLTLNAGIRHDDHDQYGGKTLFAGGGTWALGSGTVFRASYSEGFKAPPLYQLFSEYGNTSLNPEQSHGWEAGVAQHLFDGAASVGATYFRRKTTQQIIFNSCTATSTDPVCFTPGTTTRRFGYYLNLARAEAHGVELVAAAKLGEHLSLDANYSWTVAEDRSPGATFDKWLPRRPRNEANASATYLWPVGLSTGVAVRVAGKSYDNASNATKLDGYTLVDLRAEMPLSKTLSLNARVENLFDETYYTVARYGTLGRSIYGGVRARF